MRRITKSLTCFTASATFNGATTATDTEYRHNILADGEIIAVHIIDQNGSASTAYLHSDQLGSVDAITDASGSVIQSLSFDAYGQRRDAANWDYDLSQDQIATLKGYTDRGYTGQEQLDNLSLVDLNGRVYDPTVGRVISADPSIPDPGFSQAFDRYTYVYDSPLIYTDPSGFDADANPDCEDSSGSIDNNDKQNNAANGSDDNSTVQLGRICVTAPVITMVQPILVSGLGQANAACTDVCLQGLVLWDGGQQSFFLSNSTDNGGQGNSNKNALVSNSPPQTKQVCTNLKREAAQVGQALQNYSENLGLLAAGAGVVTALSGVGETPSAGLDTGITVSAGSVTTFLAGAALTTGASAAVLNAYANGNMTPLRNFNFSTLNDLVTQLAASSIPFVQHFAEPLGYVAEQTSSIATETQQEGCQ